jgi:pterin-4a-carbinolamine dehydratase
MRQLAAALLLLLLLARSGRCDYSVITAASGSLSSATALFSSLIAASVQSTRPSTPSAPVPAPPVCFTDRAAYPLATVPAWTVAQGALPANDVLKRSFSAPDFRTAFAFMSATAVLADVNNHHPLWTNVYSSVAVGA